MKVSGLALCLVALAGCSPGAAGTAKPYVHEATGFRFPSVVGDFRRVSVEKYNADGTDVGVGYDVLTHGSQIATTVFVYPAPRASSTSKPSECQAQWDNIKSQITNAHPGAQTLEEGTITAPAGDPGSTGHRALYSFQGYFAMRSQPLHSESDLFCYIGDDWFIAYRTTAPASVDFKPLLDAFMRQLSWPAKRPSADAAHATAESGNVAPRSTPPRAQRARIYA